METVDRPRIYEVQSRHWPIHASHLEHAGLGVQIYNYPARVKRFSCMSPCFVACGGTTLFTRASCPIIAQSTVHFEIDWKDLRPCNWRNRVICQKDLNWERKIKRTSLSGLLLLLIASCLLLYVHSILRPPCFRWITPMVFPCAKRKKLRGFDSIRWNRVDAPWTEWTELSALICK